MIGAASTLIPPPAAGYRLRKSKFRTPDIIDVVQDLVGRYASETKVFARQFERSEKGLLDLFNWVDRNFRYKEDPTGFQMVQTPANLNAKRVGDCKSYTVFISSVLQNLRIKHVIRYAAYGTSDFRHVYPVAILDGKYIPIDVVWKKQDGGNFGGEKQFTMHRDIMAPGLYQVGTTAPQASNEAAIIGQLKTTIRDIEELSASLPAYSASMDVTKKSKGELTRQIMEDRFLIMANLAKDPKAANQYRHAARTMATGDMAMLSGLKNDAFGREVQKILVQSINDTQPAFSNFTIKIPNPMNPLVSGTMTVSPSLGTVVGMPSYVSGIFSGIGKFIKNVGKVFAKAFKKLVNAIFSGLGKGMGPHFIFALLRKKGQVKSPEIRKRIIAQEKTFRFIQKLGKFDANQLRGLAMNGILEKTGKTPEQWAAEGGVPQLGAVAIIPAIMKAITVVVKIVEKIAGLFKKNKGEAGRIDTSTTSDTGLFEEEAKYHLPASSGGHKPAGGSSTPWLIAAGLLPVAFKLFT